MRRMLTLAACLAVAPGLCLAAEPAAIAITAAGQQGALTPADIAVLASTEVTAVTGAAPGRSVTFRGPLLWALLERAHATIADKPAAAVRQWVLVTGSDGFTAALGMGEISPEFEAKPVILATEADGKPLEPGHYTLVVPGDRRRGRSVHDVASIAVAAVAAAPAKP